MAEDGSDGGGGGGGGGDGDGGLGDCRRRLFEDNDVKVVADAAGGGEPGEDVGVVVQAAQELRHGSGSGSPTGAAQRKVNGGGTAANGAAKEGQGLIEGFFFPLVAPWRVTGALGAAAGGDSLVKGATEVVRLRGVGLQVTSAGDIRGEGDLVLDGAQGELRWDGAFSVAEEEDEGSPAAAAAAAEGAHWSGCFALAQVVEVQHEREGGFGRGTVVTLENEEHQRVTMRLTCSSAAGQEQLAAALLPQQHRTTDDGGASVPAPKEKKRGKKKRDNRRASISLDMVTNMLGADDGEEGGAAADNAATEESTAQSRGDGGGGGGSDVVDADSAMRDMVRAFVRSPARTGSHTRARCREQYSYDLSLVDSPSKERLISSPPRNVAMTQEMVASLGLRRVVKEMNRSQKLEKAHLQAATRSTIFPPKGSQKRFRYVDSETSLEIDPSEYAQRYLQAVSYKTPSPKSPSAVSCSPKAKDNGGATAAPPPSCDQPAPEVASSAAEPVPVPVPAPVPVSVPVSVPAAAPAATEQPSTTARADAAPAPAPAPVQVFVDSGSGNGGAAFGFDFEQELREAEQRLHEAFDSAIESFLDTRAELEKRFAEQQQQQQQQLALQRQQPATEPAS